MQATVEDEYYGYDGYDGYDEYDECDEYGKYDEYDEYEEYDKYDEDWDAEGGFMKLGVGVGFRAGFAIIKSQAFL